MSMIQSSPRKASEQCVRPFQHAPLPNSGEEIRVLSLEPGTDNEPLSCSLHHVKLSQKPAYEALSYMWGDASVQAMLHINGRAFPIAENLSCALFRIRQTTKPRSLWVDAICINQADIQEKSVQVAKMQTIFRDATMVLFWLGEAADDSDLAFDYMNGDYSDSDIESRRNVFDPANGLYLNADKYYTPVARCAEADCLQY